MTRIELLKRAKPILFNAEMVRAIQDGRKTVTRRVVKPQSPKACGFKIVFDYNGKFEDVYDYDGNELMFENPQSCRQIGDILYVRETWAKISDWVDIDPDVGLTDGFIYKAYWVNKAEAPKWHPSIHMPKEAARIFLRIIGVRVERLQDIDDDGVVAEGLEIGAPFDELWDSTVKKSDLEKYGWNANPWVWVIEFERVGGHYDKRRISGNA